MGLDSNDTLYVLNLNRMSWEAIPKAQQKGELPGPRDDFVFVTPAGQGPDGSMKSMYVVGGFKDGQKMNDIYKLESPDCKQFIWEQVKVKNPKVQPEPRTGFAGACT